MIKETASLKFTKTERNRRSTYYIETNTKESTKITNKETCPTKNTQDKSSEEEQNEKEVNNLPEIEFKVMAIRMINSLKKNIETIKKGSVRIKEHNV